MPTPIRTPRINNNDDEVRLAAILVDIGVKVRAGDPIIDIETDKATFTVEAPQEGYLLGVMGQTGDTLQVGSILAWMGSTVDEPMPSVNGAAQSTESANDEPTLKALLLLKAHGLRSSDVPHSGRLKAADVERHVASRAPKRSAVTQTDRPRPETPGRIEPFSAERKGMMRTVSWHRDEAVPGYIELSYDPQPWENYAAEFEKTHGLMMSPLLSLMSWRLAQLAVVSPNINATVVNEGTYLFDKVNLGFTVQAGANLYLVVLRDAASKSGQEFVQELGELQRAAMKHILTPEQSSEATIGFTSMARWKVSRHIPVLAPQTALMVAHSAPANGTSCLGATYDHRLLTGFDVVQVLRKLSVPVSES
jgi:pyruvate/2-oxoglutarate dehydrogenase complex dihydrolipoamide acyltransferase (E2) component